MSPQLREPIYTRSAVAEAVNIGVGNLAIRNHRGYSHMPANNDGKWRLYSALDVAQVIAVEVLQKYVGLPEAYRIMANIVVYHSDKWERAVERCSIDVMAMWVFVRRGEEGGDGAVTLYSGEHDLEFIRMVSDDPYSLAIFNVGPDITKALQKLLAM